MYTYKELKFDKEKREAFRKLLPFNFASLLFGKYKHEAINAGAKKPKFSYSTIRKVAAGERHNEQVLRDLIVIAEQFQAFIINQKKYKKNGTVSL